MFFNPMMGDPFFLLLTLVGLPLVFLPQMWVMSTYRKFSKVSTQNGYSGAEIAKSILQNNRVYDVSVEMTHGELSDHYDPMAKVIRLSPDVYSGRSLASAAIAAHEAGHALQHATGYYPVIARSALAPVMNLGSNLGPLLLMISIGLMATSSIVPDWALMLAWGGVALFSIAVLFHVVTLPVEINASMRAVKILSDGRYLVTSELPGAKKVLTAAAFTYVATALYSLIQLLYYVFRIIGLSERRE